MALFVISPYIFASWTQGKCELISPHKGAVVSFADGKLIDVLHQFAVPTNVEAIRTNLPRGELASWMDQLVSAGILVSPNQSRRTNKPLSFWEPHDLLFHVRSRLGKGATFPLKGVCEPERPRLRHRGNPIRLPPPSRGPHSQVSLWDAFGLRRSTREFKNRPVAIEKISDLLWATAHDRPRKKDQPLRRAYPSGGARYPLEVYAVVPRNACSGLEMGLYHYRPQDHVLEAIAPLGDLGPKILNAARVSGQIRGSGWILLSITARLLRTSWKYEGIAYSLILKETGCLLQSIYLAATALGLGACAIGRGPLNALHRLGSLDPLREPQVSEIVVGWPSTTG